MLKSKCMAKTVGHYLFYKDPLKARLKTMGVSLDESEHPELGSNAVLAKSTHGKKVGAYTIDAAKLVGPAGQTFFDFPILTRREKQSENARKFIESTGRTPSAESVRALIAGRKKFYINAIEALFGPELLNPGAIEDHVKGNVVFKVLKPDGEPALVANPFGFENNSLRRVQLHYKTQHAALLELMPRKKDLEEEV